VKPRFPSHLLESELPLEEMTRLLKVQGAAANAIAHDINNPLMGVINYIQVALDSLDSNRTPEREVPENKQKLVTLLSEAMYEAERIGIVFRAHLRRHSGDQADATFVCCPQEVLARVAPSVRPGLCRLSSSSPRSLEIAYPRLALFSLFYELLINASSHGTGVPDILVRWKVAGNRFQCEIHDNGPGITASNQRGLLPLDCLPDKILRQVRHGQGLRTLNAIVNRSRGLLLFGVSRYRGGTCVRLDLPVAAHYQKSLGKTRGHRT